MSKNNTSLTEYKEVELVNFKAKDGGNGSFEGYANNCGVLDSYDDITLRGASAELLQEFIDSGFGGVDHTWGIKDEIGIVNRAVEDENGIFIDIAYHPTDDAQKVRAKINNRLANNKKCALSIGYRVLEYEYVVGEEAAQYLTNPSQKVLTYLKERQPMVRLLKKIQLFEVSPVSVGANSASSITSGKSAPLDKEQIQAERKQLCSALKTGVLQKLQILNLKLRMISAS